MRWIRSPTWDLLWIWSGLPVGIVLAAVAALYWTPLYGFRGTPAERPLYWFFALVVMLETGHVVSPIVLVWAHPALRRIAWQRRGRFVWLALLAFAAAFSVGVITSLGWTSFTPGLHQLFRVTDWTNPMPLLVWLYLAWNTYHFGMQNFGVIRLYDRRNGSRWRRWLVMAPAVGLTILAMQFMPLTKITAFLGVGVISLNHWLVEIGLCGKVSRRPWLFTAVIFGLGAIGFAFLNPSSQGNIMVVIPAVVSARLGVSFVHFLYDRWIWRLSDPVMRAAIGQDLIRA